MNKYLPFFLFFILFATTILNAGNTGKIDGNIVDENGKPLPFTNVIIVGTSLGATSNQDGYYFIINIPPGTYNVKASYVGYASSILTGVVVSVDRTTKVDFNLNPETLNLNEVVVVANQPLVIKDKTSSSAIISADQIKELPVAELKDIVKLQAGVVVGVDGSIHIRGGRSNEISYLVNGISVTDPYSGQQGVQVENNAVQELNVISGTFNAEYGQAQSGIINIVTKEGGDKYSGSIIGYTGSYISQSNVYLNINNLRPFSYQDIQGQISGPVPGLKSFKFFLSGRYLKDDGYLYGKRLYNVGDSSDFSSPLANEWQVNPTGDGAFVPMNYNNSYSYMGSLQYKLTSDIQLSMLGSFNNREYKEYDHAFKYNPDGDYRRFSNDRLLNLSMTHVLGKRTFYEIKGAFFRNNNKYYAFENPLDPRYPPESYLESKPYNFKSGGAKMEHLDRTSINRIGKFELNSQVDNINYIKTGVEAQWYNLKYSWYRVINNERTGFKPSADPNIQGPFSREYYNVSPIQLGAFCQDKIELQDLIVNVGIRFDYFNSKYFVPEDFRDPTNSTKIRASNKEQISPRLGIAYPISDNGVLHFSYGHFFQIPPFQYLYYNPGFAIYSGSLVSIIGNADLEPERTVSYEIGLQQQLTEDIVIETIGFYKDIRNLLSTKIYRTDQQTLYARYTNQDYGNVHGITISVLKRKVNSLVGASLDYTFSIAEGNSSDPNSVFLDNQSSPPIESELQLVPLDWDQTHTINGTVSIGQRLWGCDFIVKYGSGLPYTPTPNGLRTTTFPLNSEKKPSTLSVDFQAYYGFKISDYNFTLMLNVFNLFDRRNEIQVFSETGRAAYTIIPSRQDIPVVVSDLNDYLTRSDFYNAPRLVKLGVQILFNQR